METQRPLRLPNSLFVGLVLVFFSGIGFCIHSSAVSSEVKRYFQYGVPNGTVNEIWRQVVQKLPLIKLSINRDRRLVKRDLNVTDCSSLLKPDWKYNQPKMLLSSMRL